MSKKKRVCYAGDGWEGNTEVTWHHHALAAKRELAEMLNCEFDEVNDFRRYPYFDEYEGKLTDEIKLDNGWWLTCNENGCERHVMGDEYKKHGNKIICAECYNNPANN